DGKFVAGFIGSPSMNFLQATARDGAVEAAGLGATLPSGVALPPAGQPVTLGLRPEHLEIDPAGETHRVDLTEALGGVSYAHLIAPTGEKIVVEERGDARSREGDLVSLRVDPARAYLFGADERRLR
ncbi:MAG: TOBE domain-containing protein, partial [Pseudomonadota bacterium]